MEGFLAQAIAALEDKESPMVKVYALLAIAAAQVAQAKAAERQADALEALTKCISVNGVFFDVQVHEG